MQGRAGRILCWCGEGAVAGIRGSSFVEKPTLAFAAQAQRICVCKPEFSWQLSLGEFVTECQGWWQSSLCDSWEFQQGKLSS